MVDTLVTCTNTQAFRFKSGYAQFSPPMKPLFALLLLASCTPGRIVTRYGYYPKVMLDRTICQSGKMVNRPVALKAVYEVTRWAE
jgi:hypothetical protein